MSLLVEENLARLASRDTVRADAAAIAALTEVVVHAARRAFAEHLRSVILKGSAVKGGFIPYFSDFDASIFIAAAGCRDTAPTPERALVFQEQIGMIDPQAFGAGYVQVTTACWDRYPATLTPPVPGTYTLIEGELPGAYHAIVEHPEQLRAAAQSFLRDLDHLIAKHVPSFLDRSNGGLAREVRYLATSLKPAIYHTATILGVPNGDPIATWQAPFSTLVRAVEDIAVPSHGVSGFYAQVIGGDPTVDGWLTLRQDIRSLRDLLRRGLHALVELQEWSVRSGLVTG